MKVQIFSNKGYTNSYAKIINFYYYHFASFQSDTCPIKDPRPFLEMADNFDFEIAIKSWIRQSFITAKMQKKV